MIVRPQPLVLVLVVSLPLFASGCPSVVCGPGTEEVDGVCLPIPADDDDDTTDDDDSATTDDDDATEVVDPGYPDFPDVVDVLTIQIRTGYGSFAGTDDNPLSVCLTETACFGLNVPDVDDFRVGEMDVYSWEGVGLARADVDRIQILSDEGQDKWMPHCMDIRFDGEPVYCNSLEGLEFGEEDDELTDWTDPDGLHQACDTCWEQSLTHGPMVGAVTDSTARVHLRADATRQVALHLGAADTEDAPVVAWLYPPASRDLTTEALVQGLTADTEYVFWVEIEGGAKSGFGSFRTAPAPGTPGELSVAFGSCTKADEQPAFAHARSMEPDLFLFIGDNHYANSPDLNALRWYYRWSMERDQRAQLLSETSILATWDDHDYVGNNTDGYDAGKETALRVFGEYWANPSAGTPEIEGVFFEHSWGDVDFFFVDDRYWRGFDDSVLGAPQTEWLLAALDASDATFKVLVCGSQWTSEGSSDSWASFLPARDAILDHISDNAIDGVVLLSGDVHRSEFRTTPRAAAGGYDIPEITSSPMATTNSSCGSDDLLLECFASNDYFISLDFDTAAPEPSMEAVIWDAAGVEQAAWMILASDLEGP